MLVPVLLLVVLTPRLFRFPFRFGFVGTPTTSLYVVYSGSVQSARVHCLDSAVRAVIVEYSGVSDS